MQTGFRLNLNPVKTPLGFIKLVEWFSAMFAFGCCGGYSGRNVISLFCGNEKNKTLSVTFAYPFRINQAWLVKDNVTLCNRTMSATHLIGDSSSSVEFFMAVAVLAFLYCMLALLVYVGYMHVYRDSDFGPVFDFLVTAAFAFLWLVSSSAWAQGLQKVKYATGAEGISNILKSAIRTEVTEFSSVWLSEPDHLEWKCLVCLQGDMLAFPEAELTKVAREWTGPWPYLEASARAT